MRREHWETDDLFLGRYRVVRLIKSGGMGSVYEVVDTKTDANRALKVMSAKIVEEESAFRRFELEARATGQVESDHIVRTFDWGVDDDTGSPYLVMELLRGDDLGTILQKHGRMPQDVVHYYIVQAARGLEKMHERGIVHRDIKPNNLFVTTRDDGTRCLKILDFGVAKRVTLGLNGETTDVVGTPNYMAPEQLKGRDIGPTTDGLALAHVAFTLLVGKSYWSEEFRSEGLISVRRVYEGPKESSVTRAMKWGVELPAGFDPWFHKATAKEPTARFPTVTAQAVALGEALDGLDPSMFETTRNGPARAALELASPIARTPALPPALAPLVPVRATSKAEITVSTIRGVDDPYGDSVQQMAATSDTAMRIKLTERPWPLALGGAAVVVALGVGLFVRHTRGNTNSEPAVLSSKLESVAPPSTAAVVATRAPSIAPGPMPSDPSGASSSATLQLPPPQASNPAHVAEPTPAVPFVSPVVPSGTSNPTPPVSPIPSSAPRQPQASPPVAPEPPRTNSPWVFHPPQ